MAVFDRIKTTTTSTASPFVVSTTPPTGYLGFSKFTNGATDIPVAIVHQAANEWQVCYCSWNSATNQLTVTSVLLSTNNDSAVTFSAGTKDVFVTGSSRSLGHLREPNTWTANNTFSGTTLFGASAHGNIGSDASTMYVRGNNIAFQSANTITSYAYINSSGNVGIGANTAPPARLSVTSTGAAIFGAAHSTLFATNAGSLGGTATNEVALGTLGFTSANGTGLGVRAYRHTTGSDWTTSSIILGMDVDDTVRAGAWVSLAANGNVGISAVLPRARLQATAGGVLNTPSLGSATGAPFYVTNNDPSYGLLFGTNAATGHSWIQAQRTDGSATAYNIIMNQAGGSIGVGLTSPLHRMSVFGGVSSNYNDINFPNIRGIINHTGDAGGFQIIAQGASNSTSGSGDIRFLTPTGNSAGTTIDATVAERARIAQDGTLYIATTNNQSMVSKLYMAADLTLAGSNRALQWNVYFGGSPSNWRYAANGYGFAFRENNAGKLQLYTLSNNTGGANAVGSPATLLTFDATSSPGNVGIGVESPPYRLTVGNSTTDGGFIFSSGATTFLGLGGFSAPTAGTFQIQYNRSNGQTTFYNGQRDSGVARLSIADNGDTGLCINGGSVSYRQRSAIYGSADDIYLNSRVLQNISTSALTQDGMYINFNSTGTSADNQIRFFTPGTTERMRIRGDGGVAIGTAGGDYGRDWRLVVRHDTAGLNAQIGIINGSTAASSNARFVHITGTGNSFTEHALIEVAGPANFFSTDHGSAVSYQRWTFNGFERLRLNSNGNLVQVNDTGQGDDLSLGFRGAPHNDQTGTTYTFALTDAGRAVMFKGSANATWTIPLSTTTNFPIGAMIIVDNSHFGSGTTNVIVQGATGVGIRTTGSQEQTSGRANRKQVSRGGVMTLRKLANRSGTQSVTSATYSVIQPFLISINTPVAHGYIVGDFVEVAGANQAGYNGTHRITVVVSSTQFRFETTNQSSNATGTITVRRADLWNATGNYTNTT